MFYIIIEYGKMSTLVQKKDEANQQNRIHNVRYCVYSKCFHFFYHLYKKLKMYDIQSCKTIEWLYIEMLVNLRSILECL